MRGSLQQIQRGERVITGYVAMQKFLRGELIVRSEKPDALSCHNAAADPDAPEQRFREAQGGNAGSTSGAHPSTSAVLDHLAFARDRATGRLVDVRDVPRGLACNCTCVSCGEQLLARKGDIVAWHFAHTPNTPCTNTGEAGVLDAIEAMVVQLISDNPAIELPSHVIEERIVEPDTQRLTTIVCPVAPITHLQFFGAPPKADSVECRSGISLISSIGDYKLGIILSKDPSADAHWSGIQDPLLGVVLFDLSYPSRASLMDEEPAISLARLAHWIGVETGGKQWIQHPREPLARARAARRQVAAIRQRYRQKQRAQKR